jgi:hypothetical protein
MEFNPKSISTLAASFGLALGLYTAQPALAAAPVFHGGRFGGDHMGRFGGN